MSRKDFLWFILSTFEENFQIILSPFPYLYFKVKGFQGIKSFQVKIGPLKNFQIFENIFEHYFSILEIPSYADFWYSWYFQWKWVKNTQNMLEVSNYCVAKIVDVWNVVLQIIIQIILHYFNLLFTHINKMI